MDYSFVKEIKKSANQGSNENDYERVRQHTIPKYLGCVNHTSGLIYAKRPSEIIITIETHAVELMAKIHNEDQCKYD